jgi:hypothetical protein
MDHPGSALNLTDSPANPFDGHSNMVYGERFIGRHKLLQAIFNRVAGPHGGGSLAIIGLPHIGKSSLLWQSLVFGGQRLLEKRKFTVWINVATYSDGSDMILSLVDKTLVRIEDLGLADSKILKAGQEAIARQGTWAQVFDKIQRFFQRIREAHWQPVIVLDEFDAASSLFQHQEWAFQSLRELGQSPYSRVIFATASRRSIVEIETRFDNVSNFDNIMQKHYVQMFVEQDLAEFYARLAGTGCPVNDQLQQYLQRMCGAHPHLLDMAGYCIVDQWLEKRAIDTEHLSNWDGLGGAFCNHYHHIIKLLENQNKFAQLLEVIFGPQLSVNKLDLGLFTSYGLLQATKGKPDDTYRLFSEHFKDFLVLKERTIELWPLWGQTERALRRLIILVLSRKYGPQGLDEAAKHNTDVRRIVARCQKTQERQEREFGQQALSNLLDFTFTKDLWQIINAEWAEFSPFLKGDPVDWSYRFTLLEKVRNPMAHNYDFVIGKAERLEAEGYCYQILESCRTTIPDAGSY